MQFKKLVDSFNSAINGIINTVRTERNMKIHLVAAILVLIACFFLIFQRWSFNISNYNYYGNGSRSC